MLALGINIVQHARMGNLPEDCPQQGAFPRAVRTNDSRKLPAVNMDIHMGKNIRAANSDGEILDFCAAELGTVPARGRTVM